MLDRRRPSRLRLSIRDAVETLESRRVMAGDPTMVVINEVHIHPEVKTEQIEFIELYNRGSEAVSLDGWRLNDAVDFAFPAGTSIAAGGYLVVSQDPVDYQAKFSKTALGPWVGSLNNEGDAIELWTPEGVEIDRVEYQLGFPWPTYGDLPGPSIQLLNPSLDNDLGGSWKSAPPTPGAVNSVLVDNAAPQMRQVNHAPEQPQANQAVTITARVTDPDGVQSVQLSYQLVNPGDYISQSDPRYQTTWTQVAMRDDGQLGDAAANDGTYTAIMPAELQTHRRLIRYRVTSTDSKGASRTAPYEDDTQPNFAYFVYNGVPSWTGAARPGTTDPVTYSSELLESIPVYQLITTRKSHEDAQFIPNSTRSSGYTGSDYLWEGTMVYNGRVYDHINFRARGGVWRYAMGKNMWKFDFERGHSFQAHNNYGDEYRTSWDKLNFSSIIQQGDFLNRGEQGLFESVGFRLFNLAGAEASKTNYVHFRIIENANENGADQYSGDFQGLYLAVEQLDGRFLDEHDLPDGNLYKIENNAPDSVANQGPYQVGDRSDVRAFLRTITSSTRPDVSYWRQNLELDDFYSYQAIAEAIHHYDTAFGKNFYYYNNPETGKWSMKPWDLDLTWADNMYGNANHELNVRVAKNPAFNEYKNPANISLNNRLNKEYQNRVREILNLLYNPEQTGMLIDEMAGFVYQPGQPSFVDADRAMWDYNPIIAKASRYTNSSKNGVTYRYYNAATTKDFVGMADKMKRYITTRTTFMDRTLLTNKANIPAKPTATYTGAANFPVNGLSFQTSAFSSPINAQFAALKWRVAEVTDPNAPGFNPYDTTTPRKYEIESNWESDEITTFDDSVTIPADNLVPGRTYRVRVKMKDDDGHWSDWSAPVQFVAGTASADALVANLRVSELNYNPHDPTPTEIAAGYLDGDDFEFIELANRGATPLSLVGVRLEQVTTPQGSQGVSFDFADSAIRELAPGQTVLIVENLAAFQARYGNTLPVAGEWSGKLDNSSELITLTAYGTTIQQFTYSDLWHPTTDGDGPTLQVVNLNEANLGAWNQSFGWKPSASMGGSPGRLDAARLPGDANLDGLFNSTDMIAVFQRGKYEDDTPKNASWEDGDWDGDGDFTSADLVMAFQSGAYSAAAVAAQRRDESNATDFDALAIWAIDDLFGRTGEE